MHQVNGFPFVRISVMETALASYLLERCKNLIKNLARARLAGGNLKPSAPSFRNFGIELPFFTYRYYGQSAVCTYCIGKIFQIAKIRSQRLHDSRSF